MALGRVTQLFGEMPRVDALVASESFRCAIAAVDEAERDRPWCRHGMPHLLDVARICWIAVLGQRLPIARDVVYAAALLHDIGRAAQYATGEPHDVAGARMAAELLDAMPELLRFSEDERALILAVVSGHRGRGESEGHEPFGEHAGATVLSGASEGDRVARDDDGDASPQAGASGGTAMHGGDARRRAASDVDEEQMRRCFVDVFRAADKASRPCFACSARATCHWDEGKMNLTIRV